MILPEKFSRISSPFTDDAHLALQAGNMVLLSGVVYCARDAAHRRFAEALTAGDSLPITLEGQTIFYAAPTPIRADGTLGAIGPTTSTRMDAFTPILLEKAGLKGMIGKGNRSAAVCKAIAEQHAVYLGAIGGVAALTSKYIHSVQLVAYADLATEAVLKVEVLDMPLLVLIDSKGRNYTEHLFQTPTISRAHQFPQKKIV